MQELRSVLQFFTITGYRAPTPTVPTVAVVFAARPAGAARPGAAFRLAAGQNHSRADAIAATAINNLFSTASPVYIQFRCSFRTVYFFGDVIMRKALSVNGEANTLLKGIRVRHSAGSPAAARRSPAGLERYSAGDRCLKRGLCRDEKL